MQNIILIKMDLSILSNRLGVNAENQQQPAEGLDVASDSCLVGALHTDPQHIRAKDQHAYSATPYFYSFDLSKQSDVVTDTDGSDRAQSLWRHAFIGRHG